MEHTTQKLALLLLSAALSACHSFQSVSFEPRVTANLAQAQSSTVAEDAPVIAVAAAKSQIAGSQNDTDILKGNRVENNRDDTQTTVQPSLRLDQVMALAHRQKIQLETDSNTPEPTLAPLIMVNTDPLSESPTPPPAVHDDLWHRLRQGMQLDSVDNPRIATELSWYLRHPGYLRRVMERASLFLPFILEELEARQMPTELALLPIVESAYQAFAYSPGRASGMWQIIPSTGRFLGLQQNWWYDGRRDVIESTKAAITYLSSLAKQFNGDWSLALAAYNAGPGKIRGAIRYNKKRGKPTDFWHLTRIHQETRAYVPKLFALKELFGNPAKYELDLVPVSNKKNYTIVELDDQIDLALAAELAGISMNQLYQLNPAFNRWATAPGGPHRLLLPKAKSAQFMLAVQQLPPESRINWVRHKIKSGETLSHIALRYQTTEALIMQVNKIRNSQIRAGEYLTIATAAKSLHHYSMSQKARLHKTQNLPRTGKKQTHSVRSGQSLWSIARDYGVTIAALAKWNGMAPADLLKIGQKLVIWSTQKPIDIGAGFQQIGPNQGLHLLRYRVRKGDSLSQIAARFNIRIADIQNWNSIGKYIQPGQMIKIYVDVTQQTG